MSSVMNIKTIAVHQQSITITGGILSVGSWKLNDLTGGLGSFTCNLYGNLKNLYDKYFVRGAKVEVFVQNQSGLPLTAYVWGSAESRTSNIDTDDTAYQQIETQKYVSKRNIAAITGGTAYCKIKRYFSTSQLMGKRVTSSDEDFVGDFSNDASPSTSPFFNFVVKVADNIQATFTFSFSLKVTYYVTCFQPQFTEPSVTA